MLLIPKTNPKTITSSRMMSPKSSPEPSPWK